MNFKKTKIQNLRQLTPGQLPKLNSPALLLIIITSTFFLSDAIVMFLHASFPPLPLGILSLIDSVLVIALLSPVLYYFIFCQSRMRITQLLKANEALQTQITERQRAEEALRQSEKQLRSLSFQLLTAQEAERRRLSGELHDELGQALTVIKLQLSRIERNLKRDQGPLREDCKYTLQYIDRVIENVRRLSCDLSPFILEDLGLPAALRWMANEFTKHHQIQVSLDLPDTDHLLSEQAQIIIYRIFQEMLTNIVKHAQASRVSIAVQKEEGMLSFGVEDDGKGFDMKQYEVKKVTEKGLGLTTMKERVRMLAGSLNIWSQEGEGTRITFRIPIGKGETR